MRVAAVYDVHGNLPALEAVLEQVERENVDLILSGGDVVFGPMPAASLERLLDLGDRVKFIRGNTDRAVAQPPRGDRLAERIDWVRGQLSGDQLSTINQWAETMPLDVDGLGQTLFVHATPRNDTEIVTPRTSEEKMAECLDGVGEQTIVCGHIHVQYDREVAGRRIVNAGSVGAPFGRAPGAYWAIFGPDVRHMHTPYDVEDAAKQIRATGMPGANEFAEDNVLNPPSLEHALEKYARKAKQNG